LIKKIKGNKMVRKRLRVDLDNMDIWEAGGRLSFCDGAEGVLQDIAYEINTFRGDMPLDPQYGCLIKGALGGSRLNPQMLQQEVERIATKHPDVALAQVTVDEDGTIGLSVRLHKSLGGGSASTNL
jgi:hypothetical protein